MTEKAKEAKGAKDNVKFMFLFLFFVLSGPAQGQSNKRATAFTFEYSPNLCSATYNGEDPELRWAHNIFSKASFYLNKNLRLTMGIGYMNVRYHSTLYIGSVHELNGITTTRYYNYLVFPIGLKFNIGPVFINPESGLAYNIGYHEWKSGYTQDLQKIKQRSDPDGKPTNINDAVLPVFLTIGHEIKQKDYSILVGLKSYYALSNMVKPSYLDRFFYGFGLLVGVKL